MHLTGVLRNTITVWIAPTVFCSADLMMLSARTVMFPKDVIESLSKDQEINAGPERRNT
jgi:hypothetical protein